MKKNRVFRISAGLASAITAASILWPASASAAWPADKPIRMIIPYAPGGATDILGRAVSAKLATRLGQNIVVENRPGAGSMLGSQHVSRSQPDGYTLLLGSISNVLNAYFYKDPIYNIRTDLEPVTQIVSVPNYLGVNKSVPAKSIAELIKLAKDKPNSLSCAVSGIGSSPYLSCELFKILADVKIINVPFKGGAPAIQSTIGGQTTMFFANEAMPYIQAGQVRALGVTTAKRTPYLPDVPAISETLPTYDVTAWYGVWAPAKTPPEIVNKLSSEIAVVLKDPSLRQVFASLGATPVDSNPQAFKQYINAELDRWQKITQQMKVIPQ
ncbi:tripartite tricarboxylate transporter substrate binding protein [Paralcaligenes sp. KSB-10]|jgi:tripartite-type tricarboxylate transporter receptor subunit TctC|uniref:tripartite tricarboxylate transporter substrate binding protein n=1 Tax=Paralcaligenes sp. KSB-10 TaxID=2901142 RepID=UPI001E4E364F|nr:tripartite tricarboxylate transporter substrate binding protein [Paralcaligenes sp. KSB-10]UHL63544.1 tripartite tricarboxylate transporter substrate binding protein [Paralcaligenes sp. KSB-10]